MSGRKSIWGIFGLTVSVSLLAAAVSVLLYTFHAGRMQFEMINAICGEVVEQDPEARTIIAAALKEYTGENDDGTAEENLLESLGYRISDFSGIAHGHGFLFIGTGVLAGGLLFACTWLRRNRRESLRIRALTEYLEQANTGSAPILSAAGEDTGEDDFSRLADGIYKTVTSLCQARETAVRARNGFAENLSNIAHQIKTPITAISLSVQMMEHDLCGNISGVSDGNEPEIRRVSSLRPGSLPDSGLQEQTVLRNMGNTDGDGRIKGEKEQENIPAGTSDLFRGSLGQIRKQLLRLTRLEEALLLLSRIDAGTLSLERREVDVFTLLVLAADTLQELLSASGASVGIPEQGSMRITADPDWTMEAVVNLMKNCMEHGGGKIHCSYSQNPLYTEIVIWDEGPGFAREELPHLFKRFYRGQNAPRGGIGIGLALAKEIIERQNGTLRAANRPGGGALFEIHFYSH